jgi:hypothetical protein
MGRARRTGDRVVALDAVVRLLAHITRRAYSQLVAAVRLLAPSGRWYVDTSLSFVHDRRDVPDYLARVLYSSLVVCDLVRDGGVTLVDLLTDERHAGHRDALAMSVTFDGNEAKQLVYDRFQTQDGDDVVVVVPRGNAGQHFVLTGATTYGDVWLRARGYELTKGRVTNDVTYMNMVLGEVHDIHPLPTHETHYVLVMRERTRRSRSVSHGEESRGYEYTVPVRVGRLHDMHSDGVAGIIARSNYNRDRKTDEPNEHGRTYVIAAPGAFSLRSGRAEERNGLGAATQRQKRQEMEQEMARVHEQNRLSHERAMVGMTPNKRSRLWMLIDVLLIRERLVALAHRAHVAANKSQSLAGRAVSSLSSLLVGGSSVAGADQGDSRAAEQGGDRAAAAKWYALYAAKGKDDTLRGQLLPLLVHASKLARHIQSELSSDEMNLTLSFTDADAASIVCKSRPSDCSAWGVLSVLITVNIYHHTMVHPSVADCKGKIGQVKEDVREGASFNRMGEQEVVELCMKSESQRLTDTEAEEVASVLKGIIENEHKKLVALEAASPTKTNFGESSRAFALCDGVPCLVDTASEREALKGLDEHVGGTVDCEYFTGEMYPPTLSLPTLRSANKRSMSDIDVSVLASRGRDRDAFCVVIKVADAMDFVGKTMKYVHVTDRPLMRLSTGVVVESGASTLVTYLCAYTVPNLMAWYTRYRDSKYQHTDVLNLIPAALVVVDADFAAAVDRLQAARFSCGPRVVRALVDDLCNASLGAHGENTRGDARFGQYMVLACVALAYQRSEFSMAPYVELQTTEFDTVAAAHKSYAVRVAHAWKLASSILATPSLYADFIGEQSGLVGGPRWGEWLDADGDTPEKRERQREFRDELINFELKMSKEKSQEKT